jgi:hypothetical protein
MAARVLVVLLRLACAGVRLWMATKAPPSLAESQREPAQAPSSYYYTSRPPVLAAHACLLAGGVLPSMTMQQQSARCWGSSAAFDSSDALLPTAPWSQLYVTARPRRAGAQDSFVARVRFTQSPDRPPNTTQGCISRQRPSTARDRLTTHG